jgi:predicted ribosomally synthesized peptide with SipW-like signal peptide
MSDDSSGPIELTRRRALGGIAMIGAASSAAGAGTMALFSDEETSGNNTVQAGTLDLSVNGDGSNAVIDVSNVVPDESGRDSTTLTNAGTLPGYLAFGITGFRTPENGVNDPESESPREDDPEGSSAGGSHTGELGQNLELRTELVVGGETQQYLVGHEPVDGDDGFVLASNLSLGPYDLDELELAPGQSVDFVTHYRVLNAGNEIQSDSVEIEAQFGLTQEPNQITLPEQRDVPATAVGASDDEKNAGVEFEYANSFDQSLTINNVHVQPDDTDLTLVSDRNGGTNYESFSFNADLHVETPDGDANGWVDGGSGQFRVPGWIDLDSDGYNDAADREAVLSADGTAIINLYAFRNGSGNKEEMSGKRVSVTLDVTLADGTDTFVPLVMTPD